MAVVFCSLQLLDERRYHEEQRALEGTHVASYPRCGGLNLHRRLASPRQTPVAAASSSSRRRAVHDRLAKPAEIGCVHELIIVAQLKRLTDALICWTAIKVPREDCASTERTPRLRTGRPVALRRARNHAPEFAERASPALPRSGVDPRKVVGSNSVMVRGNLARWRDALARSACPDSSGSRARSAGRASPAPGCASW